MRNIVPLFCKILMIANMFVAAIKECKLDPLQTNRGKLCFKNNQFTMNCRNLSLTEVPKSYPKTDLYDTVCVLDLSLNYFSQIKNGTFLNVINLKTSAVRILNLCFSSISYISTEAFQGLGDLQYLNLSGNMLSFPDGFGREVFKPLVHLKYLNIKENNLSTFFNLDKEIGYLRNLRGFFAELCENCTFGKDFEKLQNLDKVSLSGRFQDTCNARKLYNYTFEGLSMVKNLWLSSCNIAEIEADAFRPMNRSLTYLDISYNEKLQFDGMNKALHGLRFSSALSVLNVNRIHNVHELGVKLKASNLENLSTLRNLTQLFMDLNKIEIFDTEIFNPVNLFPSSLRVLTFDANRISFGIYFRYIHTATNITCLDISRQHLYYDPFMREHFELTRESINSECFEKVNSFQYDFTSQTCSLILPPNLRRLKWGKSFLNFDLDDKVSICGATNLRLLDLSFNLFTKLKSSIRGLEHLKRLDLSENYCSEIAPRFFDHFTELQHLNLSGNYLGPMFERILTEPSNRIFRNLKKLTNLDLSNNRIESFSDFGFFNGLTNIQHLYLHSNLLSDWDYDMKDSKSLKLVNLAQNKLTHFSNLKKNLLDKVCKNCNFTVILYNNSFLCDCDNLPFFRWMLANTGKVKIDTCVLNSRMKSIAEYKYLRELVNILQKDVCNDKTWITWTVGSVCVVFGSLFSIVAGLGVYRYRWRLRYLYYRRNRRLNHEGFERLFEKDAFVSYAKSNASFIKRSMVPSLENERGISLWVADRNSMPGTSIAENITHGINISRKSVLLIDKTYLKDSWCNYEMNMAHVESTETKRKLIIIVLMEEIPLQKLPICLMRFLRSELSLEYPVNSQDLDTFWNDLADKIMS